MTTTSTRYPILSTLHPAEAAAIEMQADAGIALSDEQARKLGLRAGVWLLPVDGRLTEQQIETAFPQMEAVLRDIVKLTRKGQVYGEAKGEIWTVSNET